MHNNQTSNINSYLDNGLKALAKKIPAIEEINNFVTDNGQKITEEELENANLGKKVAIGDLFKNISETISKKMPVADRKTAMMHFSNNNKVYILGVINPMLNLTPLSSTLTSSENTNKFEAVVSDEYKELAHKNWHNTGEMRSYIGNLPANIMEDEVGKIFLDIATISKNKKEVVEPISRDQAPFEDMVRYLSLKGAVTQSMLHVDLSDSDHAPSEMVFDKISKLYGVGKNKKTGKYEKSQLDAANKVSISVAYHEYIRMHPEYVKDNSEMLFKQGSLQSGLNDKRRLLEGIDNQNDIASKSTPKNIFK